MEKATQQIYSFLMFEGMAEEAMNTYTSLFNSFEIINITRHGANNPGKEGTVLQPSRTRKPIPLGVGW